MGAALPGFGWGEVHTSPAGQGTSAGTAPGNVNEIEAASHYQIPSNDPSHIMPSLPGTATQLFWASLQVPIMQVFPGAAQVLGWPLHWPAVQMSLMVQ